MLNSRAMARLCSDIKQHLVTHATAFLGEQIVAWDKLDRSGWLHCSDLSHQPPTLRFSPRFCVEQFFGLECRKPIDSNSASKIAAGIGCDIMTRYAIATPGGPFLTAQASLQDTKLRLRGTPDFLVDDGLDNIVGDVKSTEPHDYKRLYCNEEWDVGRAYHKRQLQSYLWLNENDWGILVVVSREMATKFTDLAEQIVVRPFMRDDKCIAKLQNDVQYLNECIDAYQAATTDSERALALPIDPR